MNYSLEFKKSALKEWRKLDEVIRNQFKKKLAERLLRPRVESARLRGMSNCYKIKLRNAGYRLVYQVDDLRIVIVVVAVDKRDNLTIYRSAEQRLSGED